MGRGGESVRSQDVAALLLKKEATDLSTSSGKVRKRKKKPRLICRSLTGRERSFAAVQFEKTTKHLCYH